MPLKEAPVRSTLRWPTTHVEQHDAQQMLGAALDLGGEAPAFADLPVLKPDDSWTEVEPGHVSKPVPDQGETIGWTSHRQYTHARRNELLMSRQDRYLVQDYRVSYRADLSPPGSPVQPLEGPALLFYDDKSGLAGAHDEVETLRDLLDPVVLDSHNWSVETFRQRAMASSQIHLAAHGLAEGEGAVNRLSLGEVGLWREDIERLELSPTCLVVVSACSGARANTHYGTSQGSLLTSFLEAGAGAALGAAWEVDDRSAALFFESFYQKVKQGRSPEEVLVELKRDWIERDSLSHPFRWAPYLLYRRLPLLLNDGFAAVGIASRVAANVGTFDSVSQATIS